MKIKYLNGKRLYLAFLAGGTSVIKQQDTLNRINVFPVADGDTGTNLSSTMRSIVEGTKIYPSVKDTSRSIADAALMGARGNSGIILAQFFHGLSSEIPSKNRIWAEQLAHALHNAVDYAYSSILEPVEGTILTVIKDWGDSILRHSRKNNDIVDILRDAFSDARKSLAQTPEKLKLLADSKVVDAGAKGFVDFLHGIDQFISHGKLNEMSTDHIDWHDSKIQTPHHFDDLTYRYCSEAILTNSSIDTETIKKQFCGFGDSFIAAGNADKMHIHIHTNDPADLFYSIKDHAVIEQIKIDDMQKQSEVVSKRKYPIALITDSACDIPDSLIQENQIHVIPFQLSFGKNLFLDRISIRPDQFYEMLENDPHHPKSSQPTFKNIQNMFSFLSSHYENIIAVHISDKLSGVYQQSMLVGNKQHQRSAAIINSRNLSVSQGLIVLRVAEAISQGKCFSEITDSIETWIHNTRMYVDVNTLKYLVRGGRVSPLKGWAAQLFNLKPIITLDENGRSKAIGTSFSRAANMKKILNMIKNESAERTIWKYAIVHSQAQQRAEEYGKQLTEILGVAPAYIMNISPVIGAHNGIGTVAAGILYED